MNKPTEAQIKEFWERCDCLEIKQFPTTHPLLGGQEVMIDTYVWKPTGQRLGHQMGACEFPPIDLNNLFKYAVPFYFSKNGYIKTFELLRRWADSLTDVVDGITDNPAPALFWALCK